MSSLHTNEVGAVYHDIRRHEHTCTPYITLIGHDISAAGVQMDSYSHYVEYNSSIHIRNDQWVVQP